MGFPEKDSSGTDHEMIESEQSVEDAELRERIAELEEKRKDLMLQLGERAYTAMKDAPDLRAACEELFDSITAIDAECEALQQGPVSIDEKDQELDSASTAEQDCEAAAIDEHGPEQEKEDTAEGLQHPDVMRICAHCGAAMQQDHIFCGNCGAKNDAFSPQQVVKGGTDRLTPVQSVFRPGPAPVPVSAYTAAFMPVSAGLTTKLSLSSILTCSQCGASLALGDRFCSVCGTRVEV